MKVLLINPAFTQYVGLSGTTGVYPPLGLGYIASYLKAKKPHYEISILDAEALALSYEYIINEVKKRQPDIVGLTSNTPVFWSCVEDSGAY